jgi:hypothetical protein
MEARREKRHPKGYAKLLDLCYEDAAGAIRVIPVMPEITSFGVALGTLQKYETGTMLLLLNTDSTIHYYAMAPLSGTAPVAPSGPTSGIPVMPMSQLLIALGDNGQIVSDSGSVYAYRIDDDSYMSQANPPVKLPTEYWTGTTSEM